MFDVRRLIGWMTPNAKGSTSLPPYQHRSIETLLAFWRMFVLRCPLIEWMMDQWILIDQRQTRWRNHLIIYKCFRKYFVSTIVIFWFSFLLKLRILWPPEYRKCFLWYQWTLLINFLSFHIWMDSKFNNLDKIYNNFWETESIQYFKN